MSAAAAFENPVAEELAAGANSADDSEDPSEVEAPQMDPTAPPKANGLTARQSTDDEIAGVAELPESILEGKALGILGPDNPLRMALFTFSTHWITEGVLLFFISLNVLILILQSPANTYGEGFNEAADNLDFLCTMIFTLECVVKIVALGLYMGPSTYLANNWNLLDFVVVATGWVYILGFKEDGATGSSTGRGVKPNVFRCIRALRPLRSLEFFAGLKAVLAALGDAWYLLLEVIGFLCFFFCIFSAMGISLFKGSLTYRCEDYFLADAKGYDAAVLTAMIGNETVMDAYFTSQTEAGYSYATCPEHVSDKCMLCGADSPWDKFVTNGKVNPLASVEMIEVLRANPGRYADTCCRLFVSATTVSAGQVVPFSDPAGLDRYDDRVWDIDFYGFDNLFRAVLSEFVATTMDEWPALSHPLSDSDSANRAYAWPFFAVMTLTLAILTANLFVSVICYAFGQLQISEGNSALARQAVAQLRAMFDRFDADGSGQIGAEETAAIAETLEIQLKEGELDKAMEAMDSDHQGDVDFQEFSIWWNSEDDLAIRMKRALGTEEHRLKLAFKQCDTDRGGSLDRNEVMSMSKVLGISLTEEENEQMMTELDENGDNEVDFGEFTSWWFAGSPTAVKVKAAFGGEDVKIKKFYLQCVDEKTGEINFATMQNFGANLNITFTKPELAQAMEEMDDDQGGTVDEEEFTHWWKSGSKIAKRVRDKLQVEEASVRILFGRLDDDNSGQVGREEMVIIGDSIGLEMTSERLDTMMGEMDSDGSGQVDADEFLTWWTSNSRVAAELKKALEPFLKKEAAPKFPYIPGLSEGCDKVVTNPMFEWIVLGLVAVNACMMATDRYPMTPDHHNTMWVVELIFCVLYSIEALIKIFAVGLIPYFKVGFNKMDFTIVIFSIVGLIVPKLEGAAALRGLRVLVKMLRVLRVFKLLSKYDTVMMLLKTVMGAWKMLINLVVFIVFVLSLFAVAGMHTVGTCHLCTPDSDPPCPGGAENVYAMVNGTDGINSVTLRENYFDFPSAIVTTFQIMSGEDWAPVMYKYMHCAGTPALIFFVLLFSISNFMMLNLFVAVILMNFEIAEEEKLIKQELNYTRNIEDSEKTDAEKNSALMWLRNRKDSRDPAKLEAMENIRAGIRKAHGEADDDDGSDWNKAVLTDYEGEDTSLGCLKIDNPLRVFFLAIGDSTSFDMLTLSVIVASSIALALDKPHNAATKIESVDDPLDDNLVIFNLFVTLYFFIEFSIKVIAYGFCFTPRGYIMDSWNVMDFSVLLISVFDAFSTLTGAETNEWTRILRLLRILRPLRMIKHAEGMKVIVNALIKCGPMVLAVGILNMVFYLIFATLGVGMFKGQFLSCSGVPGSPVDWTALPYYDTATSTARTEIWKYTDQLESFDPKQFRVVESEADLNDKDCILLGGSWDNPPYNFDNIFQAFKSLFIVSTLEGWIDVMHAGMDCAGEGNAPIKDNQFGNFLFFWGFVILGAYFVTNIFVGVMVNFFSESSGTGLLTHAQKQWQMKQLMCLSVKSRVTVLPEPGPRLTLYKIVESGPCEYFVQLCIVLNTVVMIAEHYPEDPEVTELFATLNLMFLIIFTIEAVLKIFALGPAEYVQDNWCVLDGSIVGMSWLFRLYSHSGASALRSLRILRIILLLKHAPNLKSLFGTLILSLPPCMNLTTLMSMVFFMWGICGVQFFGELPWGDVPYRRELCDSKFEAGWPNPRLAVVEGTTNMTECNWDNACGALGPPECWHPSSWDGTINKNDNFDDIFNAVATLFQISTGQDWMNMCQEVASRLNEIKKAEDFGASSTWPAPNDYEEWGFDMQAFMFFMTFYVGSVFVFLNLFVAVLLENFEMNFESEQLDLNVAHIDQFKKIWTEVTDGPKHDTIHISQIRDLVEMIRDAPVSPKSPAVSRNSSQDGNISPRTPRSSKKDPSPFVEVLDDANWFNRLMFELDCTPDDVNSDMSIGFHQLLLGLTLLQHSYEGLNYEENRKKIDKIEARSQQYAANVIGAYIRCWKVTRHVPEVDSLGREFKTEEQKRVYRAAAVCARIMVVDSAIRTNKVMKANELGALVD